MKAERLNSHSPPIKVLDFLNLFIDEYNVKIPLDFNDENVFS